MGLTFLTPWLLLGLGAVSIPIILHFIGRKRKKTVFFPSLKFLMEMQKKTVRRVQLFQILLLIVRICCIAILALLLARPVIKYTGRLLSNPGASTDAVIVLDNSMSMGYSEDGVTRFEKAKASALKILDTVTDGGSALVLLNDDSQPNPSNLNYNIAPVKDQVKGAVISGKNPDPGSSLNNAFFLLKSSPAFNKEVFFLTDLQRASLKNTVMVKLDPSMKDRAKLSIIDFGSPDFSNAAVTEASVFPRVSARGQDVEIHATVSNYSLLDRVVSANLYIDGARRSTRMMRVGAGSSASAVFKEGLFDQGAHEGWVEIDPDSLAGDDRRSFSFDVRQRLEVVFVLDDLSDGSLKQGIYLAAALNPQSGKTVSPFTVTYISAPQLEASNLSGCAAVFLMNVRQLTDPGLRRLSEYVKEGGSAVFFPGEKTDKAYFNTVLGKTYSIFPAELGSLEEGLKSKGFSNISLVDWEHPVFSAFRMPGQGDLGSAHFFRFWELKPDANSGVSMLASFENGAPFLLEKNYGKGKALAFSGLPSAGWSDFYIRPVFVAFTHEMMYYLMRAGGTASGAGPDALESDLTPIQAGKAVSYFTGIVPVILDAKDPKLIENILVRRQGISLRLPFVWLLFILLLLESILSNWLFSKKEPEVKVASVQ